MSLLTHLLAALFGVGSWISVNGLWVELPLMVPRVPEGWYLPSYLSVLIQMANIGPVCVTLMHRFRPGALNEAAVIYAIIGLGAAASFLLGFLWKETVVVGGAPRSLALLVLTFFLSAVDCTSSVTFLPFMMHLQPQFLTTYFIGEGMSGLLPALVALVQGVGVLTCVNGTGSFNHTLNSSGSFPTFDLQAQYQPAKFSAEVFFFFLSAMMLACLLAFVLLNHHPSVAREPVARGRGPRYTSGVRGDPQGTSGVRGDPQGTRGDPQGTRGDPQGTRGARGDPQGTSGARGDPQGTRGARGDPQGGGKQAKLTCPMGSCRGPQQKSRFGAGTYSWLQVFSIFGILAWANALTNGVLPSVQSYSCMPYGNNIYHLSAIMAASSNPLACFIAVFFPIRSLWLMGALTALGSAVGAYLMSMAVLSPCPLLVGEGAGGGGVIVLAWTAFVLTLSYVKVMIGVILRDEGHSALVWCGAVVQLGSLLGAVTMFPMVSVYGFFSSGDPCNSNCP